MFTSMYNNITTFIHNLFGTDEFVPLHAPLFIGNEKNTLQNALILLLSRVWASLSIVLKSLLLAIRVQKELLSV